MVKFIGIIIFGIILTALAYQQGEMSGNFTLAGFIFILYCLYTEYKGKNKRSNSSGTANTKSSNTKSSHKKTSDSKKK